MENTTQPKVTMLASGDKLTAKQMQANAGELLPAHLASLESILFVQEGECVFMMNNKEQVLKQGNALVVPPETRHQIRATKDFKAVHFMPKDIKFKFFS